MLPITILILDLILFVGIHSDDEISTTEGHAWSLFHLNDRTGN